MQGDMNITNRNGEAIVNKDTSIRKNPQDSKQKAVHATSETYT